MSDSGRVTIASLAEVTWGTTPASAMLYVGNATSESLMHTTATTQTSALRSDYTKPFAVRTQVDGGGTINFEHAYADVPSLSWLPGAVCGSWGSGATTGAVTTLSAVASTSKFHRSSGSFVSDGFVVGMWIKVSGFSTSANNGYFYVNTVAASDLTVNPVSTLVDEAAGPTVTILNSGFLTNGTTLSSFTLERQFTDLTTKYIGSKGNRVASYALTCAAGAINTGSVSFNGKGLLPTASASLGNGSFTAATTNRVTNGVDNVTAIYEGGKDSASTASISSIAFNIAQPNRPTHVLGSVHPASIGKNSMAYTGTLRLYNDASGLTLWDKHVNYTATSLSFRITDENSHSEIYTFPAIRIVSGGPNATGADSDVMSELGFIAETDPVTGYQFMVSKLA